MKRQTRASNGFVPSSLNEEKRSVDYVCSTETMDTHHTVLRQNWRLERYQANPVVLFAHNNRAYPIGHAENVRVEGKQLLATVVFATADVNPQAEECFKLVKGGLMRGISVGFDFHAYRWELEGDREIFVLDDLELLELSVCGVPSNPDTLAKSADDPTDADLTNAALTLLRAKAPRPSKKTTKDPAPMNEEEFKALRAALEAQKGQIATLTRDAEQARAALEAEGRALVEAKAKLAERDAQIKECDAKIETLTAEANRVAGERDKHMARADQAEDKLVRQQIQGRMGEDVDPDEVEHLVKLSRQAPELYEREMKKRGAGPQKGMTRQLIGAEGDGARDASNAGAGVSAGQSDGSAPAGRANPLLAAHERHVSKPTA